MTLRIEGYAIVSEDGMLADAAGVMPPSLVVEADQQFLASGLDRADILVHGRHSHENQPQSPTRRRLIVSRTVETLGPTDFPNAVLWNPAGLPLEQAMEAVDVEGGIVAVLGGTEVFGLFLPRYDAFYLSRAKGVKLPGGRPIFPRVPASTPEDVLAASGLVAGAQQTLDAEREATLVAWERPANLTES
jgi:dihydrofolate reductase